MAGLWKVEIKQEERASNREGWKSVTAEAIQSSRIIYLFISPMKIFYRLHIYARYIFFYTELYEKHIKILPRHRS